MAFCYNYRMPLEQTYLVLSLVLLVRVGQAMLLCGTVRSKNAASIAVRMLLDLAVVALGLWAIGAVFVPALGDLRYITFNHFLGIGETSGVAFRVLPVLVVTTAAIYAAAAERSRLTPLLTLSAILAAFVIPVLTQIELQLSTRGNLVDSGVGLASIVGGTMGIVAAYLIGPRKNKFNRDQSVNFLPGHHVVFQVLGLLIVIAGWAGVAGGPANVVLGASAAAVTGAAYGRLRFGKVDTGLLLMGVVGGLCASGVGAGVMPTWAAVLLGAIAGAVAPWAVIYLEKQLRLDDVVGLASAYLSGGVIGWIGAALFSENLYGPSNHLTMIISHVGTIIVSILVAGAVAVAVLTLFKKAGHLRVNETDEFDGTDLSELDVNAYPDFQQNMIKSHHLREL